MNRILITLLTLFNCIVINAQQSHLELKKIMAGNEFIGHQPENINWSPDGSEIYFSWNRENELLSPFYAYTLADKKFRKLSSEDIQRTAVDGFIPFEKGQGGLFKRGGAVYEWIDGKSSLLFRKRSPFSIVRAINDNSIIIREDNNLFLLQKKPFSVVQLTYFMAGKSPEEEQTKNFLERQQTELFEIVKLNEKRDSAQKAYRTSIQPDPMSPFYLDKRKLSGITISNDLHYCAFRCDKDADNPNTRIEKYVTADGYTQTEDARAKVGEEDPTHQLYIWDLNEEGGFHEIDCGQLTGITKRPEFLKEYDPDFDPESDLPKNVIYHLHGFNDSGDKLLVEIKSYDNKDRWICFVEVKTFQLTEIDHQHDEAWIGGPGITGWNMVGGNVGWIDDDNIYYQSEKTGYSHLHIFNIDKNKTVALTSGQWEVYDANLSKDKNRFFITANKNHPGNREFYTLDIKSRKLTPILTKDGNYDVTVSPDETQLAIRYSFRNKPWELYLAPIKENAELTQLTNSTTPEFNAYTWRSPEVFTFKASDGQDVHARIYRPEKTSKNGAGVIFVHGAGYLQNAHNWWSAYYREYMFNNLLCDLGYTVLDIDYRASEGYGRDFRTAIYRHMGGKDLSDQVDGRNFLIQTEAIDSNRIGIYGGSYGGFITLMALLTEPGKFKCGAALRSVTDWAHYNHPYTSKILNTPEKDPIAFKRSSPIYFAENLRDELVMLHGIQDDNVQYQDVVRLSQRFIELGKTSWDLVGFPIERHGFKETSSWIEEYRRILELFQNELK